MITDPGRLMKALTVPPETPIEIHSVNQFGELVVDIISAADFPKFNWSVIEVKT